MKNTLKNQIKLKCFSIEEGCSLIIDSTPSIEYMC